MAALGALERDRLIVENLPLVGYLASAAYARGGGVIAREDLSSAGALALVMAADTYDAARGVPFGAYARRRIIGAFLDEMRAADWASRGIRRRVKATTAVKDTLTAGFGRTATAEEIATAMGEDISVVVQSLADASRVVTSYDEDQNLATSQSLNVLPDEAAEDEEQRALLCTAIEALPERMRFIIRAVYFEERTVKEIAAELEVTHSAVSQQRAEAVRLLRDAMARYRYGDQADLPVASRVSSSAREAYLARITEMGRRVVHTLAPEPMLVTV